MNSQIQTLRLAYIVHLLLQTNASKIQFC